MRVALVHDDLMQWGGAERTLLALSELFPDAPIYTSVFNNDNRLISQQFKDKKVITSFLQKIPGWQLIYKQLLLLYPMAFEQFDLSSYDLVISHTTRFAKSVITTPTQTHLCYMHTPPRFLWHFPGDSTSKLFEPIFNWLRLYDQITSHRVDHYLAGSENAQQRIAKIYKQDSEVLYPFVELADYKLAESFEGGYFLVIARLNSYKKVDIVVRAFKENKLPLKIIGVGPELARLVRLAESAANIEFLGSVSESLRKKVISGCQALILPGEEDFGLTPIEAQAAGKPVIAYGSGGAKETIINGQTGLFFSEQTADALNQTIETLLNKRFSAQKCRQQAEKFSKEQFQKRVLQLCKQLTPIKRDQTSV